MDWTDQEDQRLRSLVIADREKDFDRVASRLNITGRDAIACQQRWRYLVESEGARKIRGRWTAEEDDHLASLVHEFGTRNWRAVASNLSGRLPKQCRERWHNQLDPSVRKDSLSPEEWRTLRDAHAKYGNKWAEIVKVLPGRTANHVKNQWNTMVRRRESETSKKRKWHDSNGSDATTDSNDDEGSDCAIDRILSSPKRMKLDYDAAPESPSSEFDVLVELSVLRSQVVASRDTEDVPTVSAMVPAELPSFHSFESTLASSFAAPSSLSHFLSSGSVWSNYVDVMAQQSVLDAHRMQLALDVAPFSKGINSSPLDNLCSIALAAFKPH